MVKVYGSYLKAYSYGLRLQDLCVRVDYGLLEYGLRFMELGIKIKA